MFTVIIPARRHSTRLPNKPLLDIAGLPMVVRTAQQASQSQARQVIIATDDQEILDISLQHGYRAVMTDSHHPTGTDRLAQVCEILNLAPEEIVVNVQGDEPLIDPSLINQAAETLINYPQAAIATTAAPIHTAETLFNPNAVKVVCAREGQALYFSRAPIPWARDALIDNPQLPLLAPGLKALHHIGLYAYRVAFLKDYPQLPQGTLEQWESLEQLRALENGYRIQVFPCTSLPSAGVDTQEDLERVRRLF